MKDAIKMICLWFLISMGLISGIFESMEIKKLVSIGFCIVVVLPLFDLAITEEASDFYSEKYTVIKISLIEIVLLLVPFFFFGMSYLPIFVAPLIYVLLFIFAAAFESDFIFYFLKLWAVTLLYR